MAHRTGPDSPTRETVLTRTATSPFTSVRYAPRSTRRRVVRALFVLGALLIALMVVFASAGWVYANRRFEPTVIGGLATPTASGPTNVLVLHTEEAGSPDLLAATVVQGGGSRTTPVGLHLPLDLEMTSPDSSPGPLRQLYGRGGHDAVVAAVTDYTGLPIHHLVHLRLAGLERLALAAEPTGCPDGACVATSLDGLRTDRELTADELHEHLDVLGIVGRSLGDPWLIASPLKTKRVLDAVPDALATDVELGPRSAMRWAEVLATFDASVFDVRTVPGYHDPATGVTRAHPEQAETLFQALRDGTALPASVGTKDPREDLLVPERVRVLVLNGVGTAGLAAAVAEDLTRATFDVVGADNAETFDDSLEVTQVHYRPGSLHLAELVARHLEGVSLVERASVPSHVDVVVLVGRDRTVP